MTEGQNSTEPRQMLDTPYAIATIINERVPGLTDAFLAVDSALLVWFPTTKLMFGREQAEHIASSMANNDFLDLLGDLLSGRGRPAVRSMRSLFEHLVTVLDVTGDPTAGARFLAHRAVVQSAADDLTFEVDALTGVDKKAEQHRLRKLKRDGSAERDATAALKTYGSSFRAGWAEKNLFERASAHGLASDYEVYRLTSAILHGSAGGAIGTVHDGPHGSPVHRLGPALALCPLSYLRGFAYYRQIVQVLAQNSGRPDVLDRAQPLLDGMDAALRAWPNYRRAILALDNELWDGTLPVIPLMTVLSLDRDGNAAWWLWDLVKQRIVATKPPRDPALAADVNICRAELSKVPESYWQQRQRLNVVMDLVAAPPSSTAYTNSGDVLFDERPEAVYRRGKPLEFVYRHEYAPAPALEPLVRGGWKKML